MGTLRLKYRSVTVDINLLASYFYGATIYRNQKPPAPCLHHNLSNAESICIPTILSATTIALYFSAGHTLLRLIVKTGKMGKFILHVTGGGYRFTFHSASGDKIATSPSFITKSSAQQALHETRAISGSAHLYKKCESGGHYYFELYSAKEQLLMGSEKHWSEASRDYGITLIKRVGSDAVYIEAL